MGTLEGIVLYLVAIVTLGVLIFVHELGHFLLAKWNGVGVLEFSIGFGKILFKRKVHETTYSLRLIPLGGFVRMVGDDFRQLSGDFDEQLTREQEELSEEEKALLADRSRWFLTRKFWPKVSIVLAGPGFNILFAIFASMASFAYYGKGVLQDQAIIGGLLPGFPAEKAGLQENDRVLKIDGRDISSWEELASTIQNFGEKPLEFTVQRDVEETSQELQITITPTRETSEIDVIEGVEGDSRAKIGIYPSFLREPVSFWEACQYGFLHTLRLSVMVIRGTFGMISGQVSTKNIAGPITIFSEAAKSAKKGFEKLIDFAIFLSISLAILNLLPIPILDGGHLMFFIIEALKGGPVSLRIHALANQLGMALLLLLMVFAFGNDIFRLATN